MTVEEKSLQASFCVEDLIKLVESNDRDGLKASFELEGFDVNMSDSSGKTALHHAVISDKMEMIEIILSHPKININAVDKVSMTPLMYAAQHGNARSLRFLLEKGADASQTNLYGCTALIIAAESKSVECLEALLKNKKCSSCAQDAYGQNALMHGLSSFEVPQKLIELSDLSQIDIDGHTSLHFACGSGRFISVKLIVEKYVACINIGNINNVTPVQIALCNSYTEIANYLAEKGASLTYKDSYGHPAYTYAAKFDDSETFLEKYEPEEQYLDGMFVSLVLFKRYKTLRAYAEKCVKKYRNGLNTLNRAVYLAFEHNKAESLKCLLTQITDRNFVIHLARDAIISGKPKLFEPLYERLLELKLTRAKIKDITRDLVLTAVRVKSVYVGNYLLDRGESYLIRACRKDNPSLVEALHNLRSMAGQIDTNVCIRIQNSDQDMCMICRDDFVNDDCTTLLPCKHLFHQECFNEWDNLNDICPYCQQSTLTR